MQRRVTQVADFSHMFTEVISMTKIPTGVNVKVDGKTLVIKGPKGEVKRYLPMSVKVDVSSDEVLVKSENPAMIGTFDALIRSAIIGVTDGYKLNLKLLHAHFPISLEVKGSDLTIKNFLGEKQPRRTVLLGSTKVEVKGQNVTISGVDKEAVGQTLANLRTAMRIKDKDGRVFQDGIYEVAGE